MKSTSTSAAALVYGLVALVQAYLVSSSPSTICSPNSCSPLPSSLDPTFGASTPLGLLLLPGTYGFTALPSDLISTIASFPLQSLATFANFTLSSRTSPFTILPNQGILLYDQAKWAGVENQFFSVGVANVSVIGGRSALLGDDVWAKLVVAGEEKVIRGNVRDFQQAPFGLKSKDWKEIVVNRVESDLCSTPCSSGGSCQIGSSGNATCVCEAGFTGASCESCKAGFFGSSCSPCASSCLSSECNDGVTGTGICKVSTTNSTVFCNCLSGACLTNTTSPGFSYSSSTTCLCSPGFSTPFLSSIFPAYSQTHQQCSVCSSGYFSTSAGECLVCAIGVATCTDASTPTTCVDGYELDSGKCVASAGPSGKGSKCSGSNWWNAASSACEPCSPLCSTCSSSDSTACLSCPSGEAVLRGVCVALDQSTGECDSSKISAGRADDAGWFFDNEKGECDTCPPKSTGCSIFNFNSTSTRANVVSKACVDGYALSLSGACVTSCPNGQFANDASVGECVACDSSCGTCSGYSTFCTSCASTANVAMGGSCLQTTCPSTTTEVEGECLKCHPDCKTCLGTSFDQCSSCPSDRPVLDEGRCLPVCKKGQYLDASSEECVGCDASCTNCIGPGPLFCLSCSTSDHVPLSGFCVVSNCTSAFVPYLQICLDDLIAPTSSSSYFPAWAIILVVLLLGLPVLGAWWYIKNERERTRLATLRFAHGLDEVEMKRNVLEAGMEGVLGVMGRAREEMERRWRERGGGGGGGLRLGGTGRGSLKPFKLGTVFQHVQVGEFDLALADGTICRTGSFTRKQRQQQPPSYSPSTSNSGPRPTLEKFPAKWRSIRSSDYTIGSEDEDDVPPSPPNSRSHHTPFNLDLNTTFSFSSSDPSSLLHYSTIAYPSLAPLLPTVARPSLPQLRSSDASVRTHYAAATSSSFGSCEPAKDRTVDTEEREFDLGFQEEYVMERARASRGASRFVEGGGDGSESEEEELTQVVGKGEYWMGREPKGMGNRNPFKAAGAGRGGGGEREETMWI